MKWFLQQEVAGEAGFDDLVAMTQVKLPCRAKLEMARNYWDEMGQGHGPAMHGALLDRLVETRERPFWMLGPGQVAGAFMGRRPRLRASEQGAHAAAVT